jgi:hypothetical protein
MCYCSCCRCYASGGGGRELMIHSFTQRRYHRCGRLTFVENDARRSLLLVTDSTLLGWVQPLMMMSFTSKVICHRYSDVSVVVVSNRLHAGGSAAAETTRTTDSVRAFLISGLALHRNELQNASYTRICCNIDRETIDCNRRRRGISVRCARVNNMTF